METYAADLTDRGFPCVYSDTITERHPKDGRDVIAAIKADSLAYFLFFNEDPAPPFAYFELGLAIQTKALIVIITQTPDRFFRTLIDGKKIISAADYENFVAQRFFAS